MTKDVETYFSEGCGRCLLGGTPDCKVHVWSRELKLLRNIILTCGVVEESKWGVACYTFRQKNILLLSAFKNYCAISFLKGALLSNEHGLLEKPGQYSQAARLIKFTGLDGIRKWQVEIRNAIYEAIELEKEGLEVPFEKNPEPIPEELESTFENDPVLKNAFEALTPGRQRGYIIFFSSAKQSKTRQSRIEKSKEKIMNGVGLNDTYSRKKQK